LEEVMAGFRVFAFVVCAIFVGVGLVNGEEGADEASGEPPPVNPVVFGGVEVCGPIYEALMFLGPKDESGRLDPARMDLWPYPSGLYDAVFPVPAGASMEFAGQSTSWMALGEFEGKTQVVKLVWLLRGEPLLEVWSEMNERLRRNLGEPGGTDDNLVYWLEGPLRTVITLDVEGGLADFAYHCVPTEKRFWDRVASDAESEEPAEIAEASIEYRPSEKVLGTPLLSVLGVHGEPDGGPYRRGQETLGLYFEEVEFLGIRLSRARPSTAGRSSHRRSGRRGPWRHSGGSVSLSAVGTESRSSPSAVKASIGSKIGG
jgi:hypothetical protein